MLRQQHEPEFLLVPHGCISVVLKVHLCFLHRREKSPNGIETLGVKYILFICLDSTRSGTVLWRREKNLPSLCFELSFRLLELNKVLLLGLAFFISSFKNSPLSQFEHYSNL